MQGSQEPRIKIEPKRVDSDGADAAELMEAYAYRLDPWQQNVIECWLGRDEEGMFSMTSAGLAVPRQNGKNVCIEARELYGMLILGEKILHTAHQVRTSKKAFHRLASIFEDRRHPEISKMVRYIRRTNGEECIELHNGGSIEYSSRSRQAARGMEGISLLVFDEAQELTDDQIESMLPTLAASATGTRQIIYTGTPPYPTCPGDIFKRKRRECINTPGEHDAWHEWSVAADGIEDIDTANVDLWYMTNPALGRRLTEKFASEELQTLSKDGFARERLGWWMPALEYKFETAISAEAWKACRSNSKKPEGKTAFGVKFSADGSEVCLCGAVLPKDGKARITMIKRESTVMGLQWLADWLNSRSKKTACVVIDGQNGVDVLINKICDTWTAKNSIIRANTKNVIASVSMLTDAISEKQITWYTRQKELDTSATTATKRPIGKGWGFGGDDSIPIEAAALAYWGVMTTKRDPNKKMRIG